MPTRKSRPTGWPPARQPQNTIAAIVAEELGTEIEYKYTWRAQRRDFFRQVLSAGQSPWGVVVVLAPGMSCDLARNSQGDSAGSRGGRSMLLEEFNFKREVLDDAGPVLVDFWAAWCGPCRMMSPVMHALARDFKVCKVNTESNPQLAAKFGVSAIPLLLVFRNGKVVRRFEGVTDEAALRAALSGA